MVSAGCRGRCISDTLACWWTVLLAGWDSWLGMFTGRYAGVTECPQSLFECFFTVIIFNGCRKNELIRRIVL